MNANDRKLKEAPTTTSNKQHPASAWPRRIKLTTLAAIVAALGLGLQLAGPRLARERGASARQQPGQ